MAEEGKCPEMITIGPARLADAVRLDRDRGPRAPEPSPLSPEELLRLEVNDYLERYQRLQGMKVCGPSEERALRGGLLVATKRMFESLVDRETALEFYRRHETVDKISAERPEYQRAYLKWAHPLILKAAKRRFPPVRKPWEMSRDRTIAWACAVWSVILAVHEFDDQWIYDLSHWAFFAIAALGAWQLIRFRWVLVAIAILYNPIRPISFEREHWEAVNWISALVFVFIAWKGLPRKPVSN